MPIPIQPRTPSKTRPSSTTRTSSSPLAFAVSAGLLVGASMMTASLAAQGLIAMDSQDISSMNALGSIQARVENRTQEWVTLGGEVGGEMLASASWQPITMPESPMARMMATMNEQQRQQMEQAMGASGIGVDRQYVRLRIVGFDPESAQVQRPGMLSIELGTLATNDMDAVHAQMHEADISYFMKTDDGTSLLVADTRSAGATTGVEFDRLEVNDGAGFAEGRFTADLCPMRQVMSNNIDPASCLSLEGEFATELVAEEAISVMGR